MGLEARHERLRNFESGGKAPGAASVADAVLPVIRPAPPLQPAAMAATATSRLKATGRANRGIGSIMGQQCAEIMGGVN
jgi:hypothetical protein